MQDRNAEQRQNLGPLARPSAGKASPATQWQGLMVRGRSDCRDKPGELILGASFRDMDELVLRDRDEDDDGTLDNRLYALQEGNFNVTGIVDTSGDVEARFAYSPYGERKLVTSGPDYGWNIGYQGLMHEDEGTLIYNRARYLHPAGVRGWDEFV